jgi:hypothetical protein
MNNPLSFTDPSGFSAWTRWRRTILAIATAITMQWYLMPAALGGAVAAGSISASTANFISAVASGFASGGIAGGNIQSALRGALTAGLMQGLLEGFNLPHGAPQTVGQLAGKVAVHAAVGCAGAAMAGGNCGRGAAVGGFAELSGALIGDGPMGYGGLSEGTPAHFAAQVVAGCAAGKIGGGTCSNGAYTAAFNYTTNIWGALIQGGRAAIVWLSTRQAATVAVVETGALIATGTAGVGSGLTLAGPAAVNVTSRGLSIVENHLATVDYFVGNAAMLERLRGILASGKPATGADAAFYLHELAEASHVARGMTRELAHTTVLSKFGHSPYQLYHPDVIQAHSAEFNNSWRSFWGVKK